MTEYHFTAGEGAMIAALYADALAHFDGVGLPIASTRRAAATLRAEASTTAAQAKGYLRSLEAKRATVRGPDEADHPGRGPRFYTVTFADDIAERIAGEHWAAQAKAARKAEAPEAPANRAAAVLAAIDRRATRGAIMPARGELAAA